MADLPDALRATLDRLVPEMRAFAGREPDGSGPRMEMAAGEVQALLAEFDRLTLAHRRSVAEAQELLRVLSIAPQPDPLTWEWKLRYVNEWLPLLRDTLAESQSSLVSIHPSEVEMGCYNASPSLSRDALDAALTDDAVTYAGPFVCVDGCGTFKVERFESRMFVCPECRSLLVPQRIASDADAVRQYAHAVLGGRP